MDVFEAFPEGIISGVWEIGKVKRATTVGKMFKSEAVCDVIVDEGTYVATDRSPSYDYEESNTLLYAKTAELPTTVSAVLTNEYLWHNLETDLYYEIREASLGKNQEDAEIEHMEFLLRPTEVVNG